MKLVLCQELQVRRREIRSIWGRSVNNVIMLLRGLRCIPVGGAVKSGGKRLKSGGYAERLRSCFPLIHRGIKEVLESQLNISRVVRVCLEAILAGGINSCASVTGIATSLSSPRPYYPCHSMRSLPPRPQPLSSL